MKVTNEIKRLHRKRTGITPNKKKCQLTRRRNESNDIFEELVMWGKMKTRNYDEELYQHGVEPRRKEKMLSSHWNKSARRKNLYNNWIINLDLVRRAKNREGFMIILLFKFRRFYTIIEPQVESERKLRVVFNTHASISERVGGIQQCFAGVQKTHKNYHRNEKARHVCSLYEAAEIKAHTSNTKCE